MGPPLPRTRRSRPARPLLQAPPLTPAGSRGDRAADHRPAPEPPAGPGPHRRDPRPARLHGAPGPDPPPHAETGLAGPPHRGTHPPLRTRPARRTPARRCEETRPAPRGRRLASPRPRQRTTRRHPRRTTRGLRVRPLRHRRLHPPRLRRNPPRRNGHHLRRIPPPRRHRPGRTGHRPDRTSHDRQRPGLPPLPRLARHPHRTRRRGPLHPPLPAANQRKSRTVQPHPRRRMGLRPALHQLTPPRPSATRIPPPLQPPPQPTPQSAANHPSPASTTSQGTTASRAG